MLQSLYSAKMGIMAQQTKVDVIANNIANINTYGFKGSGVSFKDALYSAMRRPVESEEDLNLQQGNGVMVAGIKRFFSEGAPVVTGVPLDFRIEGDGFFTIEGENGEQLYTRSGTFAVSTEGAERYLVDATGSYVLDTGLNRIELPADINEFTVNNDGDIYINETYSTTLNIVSFSNNEGLAAAKNGCFAATEASGEPQAATASVYQGSLERSNVDLALEMTKLIRAQRAFTLVSRALTTADEMSATANNMRT
jgi:flagellar basal-body rod protein FlgG